MFRDYVFAHWEHVRAGLVEVIGRFDDTELNFRPFATSWTARELMLHIAQEERGEFQFGVTHMLDAFPAAYDVADYPTVDSIQSLLAAVHAETLVASAALSEGDMERVLRTPWGTEPRLGEMLGHIVEHEIHHRGELSLMLGHLGRAGLDA